MVKSRLNHLLLLVLIVALAGSATAATMEQQASLLRSNALVLTAPKFDKATSATKIQVSKILPLAQNLLPAKDNVYTLGSAKLRWKSIQLGPGTLYIQDQITGKQAGLAVADGVLLLDGAQSLRVGNIQITATGIESTLSDQDITIGATGDRGLLATARGIRFPDGSIQSSASVVTAASTGSTTALDLNSLIGPTGPIGLQGPQGLPGSTGSSGPPGANGATGATGSTGAAGTAGATGAAGAAGATGAALNILGSYATLSLFNAANLIGNPGESWIISATGDLLIWNATTRGWQSAGQLLGPQGETGATGLTGLTGPAGVNGSNGTNGANGADGAVGAQGATGLQGPAGLQGATGETGLTGLTGAAGADGAAGVDGAAGAAGAQGATGATGAAGATTPTVMMSYASALANNATHYFTSGPAVATEANIHALFPAGTVARLSLHLYTAPGAGNSYTFTVMNNGVATSISCIVADTATTCSDLIHSSIFTENSNFTIRSVPFSNPVATGVSWSIKFTG